ncbi:HNH endonuclease [uncultured Methanomethylovorans sp.]|uniref:HNH endonuclease signature motif containing protein n=1 Tax=uncultured Methanomethylovorans sp. TaxID=183759 RepID=UPI002AA7ADC5|nr:HNH endonuclease [uncultured Methanomethylovorans sp.]
MDKNEYQKSIKKQQREGKTTICCSTCGVTDSSIIEMHHIFGRNNSEKTVPLCKNCHAKITYQQNKLAPKIRSVNASSEEKRRFLFVSMGGILRVISDQLLTFGFEGDFS